MAFHIIVIMPWLVSIPKEGCEVGGAASLILYILSLLRIYLCKPPTRLLGRTQSVIGPHEFNAVPSAAGTNERAHSKLEEFQHIQL
jgi:hypothetical protein